MERGRLRDPSHFLRESGLFGSHVSWPLPYCSKPAVRARRTRPAGASGGRCLPRLLPRPRHAGARCAGPALPVVALWRLQLSRALHGLHELSAVDAQGPRYRFGVASISGSGPYDSVRGLAGCGRVSPSRCGSSCPWPLDRSVLSPGAGSSPLRNARAAARPRAHLPTLPKSSRRVLGSGWPLPYIPARCQPAQASISP